MTNDLRSVRAATHQLGRTDAMQHTLGADAELVLGSSLVPVHPALERLERAVLTDELPPRRVRKALTRVFHLKTGWAP